MMEYDFFQPLSPEVHPHTHGGNKAFYNIANDYTHISDPNLRRRLALSDIDKVPLGLYHVRSSLVAGIGFFLDSYDIFAINLIAILLGVVFWQGNESINGFGGNDGRLPVPVSQALKGSTSAGIIIGQALFGWLADKYGRRRMYGIELAIILLSTMNYALANPSPAMSSTGLFTFWRVMMGVGIGGDYPLSAVITSEFAPTRWRGAMMAAVFSMQGIGQLTAAIVALVVTVAFKDSFINIKNPGACDYLCQVAADRSWRIVVGAGAVPACVALYYRITIPETPRYTFDVAHDVEKADADIKAYVASQSEGVVDPVRQAKSMKLASPSLTIPSASWPDVFSYFGQWKNFKVLLGTTLSWFFLDLAFYGLGLNNSIVLRSVGYSNGETLYHILYNNAVGMIILTCAGSLPGYWTAILTVDNLGRKPIQVMGFLVLTVIFCILGFAFHRLTEIQFLVLYVVAQFFFNWGPNTTTFLVPGECFPTRYRSTGHGISAAMGKVGAILAQVISVPLLDKDAPEGCEGGDCSPWVDRLMQIFALFMLCGLFVSLLIPETKGATLEVLAGEEHGSTGPRRGSAAMAGGGSGSWWAELNPFPGGQPAGFSYSRLARGHRGRKGWHGGSAASASETGGIERKASVIMSWHSRLSWKKEGAASSEGGSGNGSAYAASTSTVSGGRTPAREYNVVKDEMPTTPPRAATMPSWGAGWGRVERISARPAAHMENIRLEDVGSLLK